MMPPLFADTPIIFAAAIDTLTLFTAMLHADTAYAFECAARKICYARRAMLLSLMLLLTRDAGVYKIYIYALLHY